MYVGYAAPAIKYAQPRWLFMLLIMLLLLLTLLCRQTNKQTSDNRKHCQTTKAYIYIYVWVCMSLYMCVSEFESQEISETLPQTTTKRPHSHSTPHKSSGGATKCCSVVNYDCCVAQSDGNSLCARLAKISAFLSAKAKAFYCTRCHLAFCHYVLIYCCCCYFISLLNLRLNVVSVRKLFQSVA